MLEHRYYTFWFYQSDTKAVGLALTNRGPKLIFETRSQSTIQDAEKSEETS